MKTFRIGMVGTFDVANFGDLLFPLLARHELARRLGQVEIRPFSYHARSAPTWPFDVIPLERLATELPSLDLLLVGGGDIIRFDSRVARDYRPGSPRIHHPTGFWLAPIFMAHAASVPVAWNAPGLPGPIPGWARALMRASVAVSAYVSVRDAASRDLLRAVAPDSTVELVPDTGFNAAALLPDHTAANDAEPYLVVQSRPDWRRWIPRQPAEGGPLRLILTPVGPAIGDLVHPPAELPVGTTFLPPIGPSAMLDVIARSSGVVGPSLHLTIAALSLGRPAFRPRSAPRRKYGMLEGLVGVRPFDQRAPARESLSEPEAQAPDPAQLAEIHRRLERHWDTIASLARKRSAQQSSLKRSTRILMELWEGLPATLERRSAAEVLRGHILAFRARIAR